MSLDIDSAAHPLFWQENQSGNLVAQGCSGDGKRLACLYSVDKSGTGTLKVFDPIEKRQIWGSKGSYDLNASKAGMGQVPFITSTGQILASDNQSVVRYTSTGALVKTLKLTGSLDSLSFGVVGLTQNIGLVNQKNGALTAFDLDQLTNKGSIQLKNNSGSNVRLSSPVSAHKNRVYAATQESGTGLMNSYLKAIEATNNTLSQKWEFSYRGMTGASAVVVPPQISGRVYPMLLLHTPARAGSSTVADELVALEDQGSTFKILWRIPLSSGMEVSPLINPGKRHFYLQLKGSPALRTYDFNGVYLSSVNIRTLEPEGMNWSDLTLNGHLVGTFTAATQMVFLSGGGATGQFVMGLDPVAGALVWATQTFSSKEQYTGAWTIQTRSGGNCPIVLGPNSGISVLCPSP